MLCSFPTVELRHHEVAMATCYFPRRIMKFVLYPDSTVFLVLLLVQLPTEISEALGVQGRP